MKYADIPKHKLFQDLTGMKFNMLLVIGYVGRIGSNNQWECLCVCGNKKIVAAGNLKNNHTRSCGCFHKNQTSQASKTHGKSNSNEYKIWAGMKSRCSDIKNPKYGGRGIKVCDRWINSFENFLNDMGCRPSKNYSIERIDVNGNYEPDNCRWATTLEQANNTRYSVRLTYKGRTQTLSEWARELGVPRQLFGDRYRTGASAEEIIEGPKTSLLPAPLKRITLPVTSQVLDVLGIISQETDTPVTELIEDCVRANPLVVSMCEKLQIKFPPRRVRGGNAKRFTRGNQ